MDSVPTKCKAVIFRIILVLFLIEGIQGQCDIGTNNVVTLCYTDSITINSSSPGFSYTRGFASRTYCQCNITSSNSGGQAVNLHVTVVSEPLSTCTVSSTLTFENTKQTRRIRYCSQKDSTADLTLENGQSTRQYAWVHTDMMCLKFEVAQGEAVIKCQGSGPPPPINGTVPPMASEAVTTTTISKSGETTHSLTRTQPVSTNSKDMMSTSAQQRVTSTIKSTAQVTTLRSGPTPSGGAFTQPSTRPTSATAPPSTTGQEMNDTASTTEEEINGTASTTEQDSNATVSPGPTDGDSSNIWENNKEGIIAGVICAGTIIGISLIVYMVRKRKKAKKVEEEVERRMMESGSRMPNTVPSTLMADNPIYDATDDNFESNINYSYFHTDPGKQQEVKDDTGKSVQFSGPDPVDKITNAKNGPDPSNAVDGDRPVDAEVGAAANPEHGEGRTDSGDSGQDSDNIEMVVTNMNSLVNNQRDSLASNDSN